MEQTYLVIILFLIKFGVFAQGDEANFEFIGTLQLSKQELITYKLNFTLSGTNITQGTSVTDIYGENRTSSKLKGTYDTLTGILSFTEVENIATNVQANAGTEFCYIHCNQLKTRVVKGKRIVSGNFTGKFKNGNQCAKGAVYLIESKYVYKMANDYINSKQETDSIKKLKENINVLKDKAGNYQLKANSQVSVETPDQELIIDIWDGGTEDNDEIELYINDKKVLDQLLIKSERKTFVFRLEKGMNTVKIVALKEGISAPCTPNILIRNKGNEIPFKTYLRKKESATIKIEVTP